MKKFERHLSKSVSAPLWEKQGKTWNPKLHFTGMTLPDECKIVEGLLKKFSWAIVAHFCYAPYPGTFSVELQFAENETCQAAMKECLSEYKANFDDKGRIKKNQNARNPGSTRKDVAVRKWISERPMFNLERDGHAPIVKALRRRGILVTKDDIQEAIGKNPQAITLKEFMSKFEALLDDTGTHTWMPSDQMNVLENFHAMLAEKIDEVQIDVDEEAEAEDTLA